MLSLNMPLTPLTWLYPNGQFSLGMARNRTLATRLYFEFCPVNLDKYARPGVKVILFHIRRRDGHDERSAGSAK